MVGRFVRRRHFGDQRSQIEIEAAIEGTLGGVTVDGRQDHAGDQQNDRNPGGRRQKQPGRKRTAAHQGIIPNDLPPCRVRSRTSDGQCWFCVLVVWLVLRPVAGGVCWFLCLLLVWLLS